MVTWAYWLTHVDASSTSSSKINVELNNNQTTRLTTAELLT